jgi:hypothetical protein
MKKEFVTYEIAVAFKELGFDESCLGLYSDEELDYEIPHKEIGEARNSSWDDSRFVTAPLWQQVIDWMLNEYRLYAYVAGNYSGGEEYTGVLIIKGERALKYIKTAVSTKFYATPEEAREAVILKFIELVKNPKY